jgi:hypothetical protein
MTRTPGARRGGATAGLIFWIWSDLIGGACVCCAAAFPAMNSHADSKSSLEKLTM